jgi:lipopolysaccharide/colanic/teichoic acid biosynthesis glycosyltransferase
MSKSGEAWTQSPEKQAFERALIASLSPAIGGVALSTAAVLRVSQRGPRVRHSTSRSLYPGHVFTVKKFGDPESDGRVERLLRQTMLDELPQVSNVWRGSMSLFGPRADTPAHIKSLFEAIEDEEVHSKWLEARSKQKPGVISSYAIYSHAHNLAGASEAARFSEAELLTHNAMERATLDIHDFENASLAHDLGLLRAAGLMVAGNYGQLFAEVLHPSAPSEAV